MSDHESDAPTPEETVGYDPLPELMLPQEVADYFRVTPYTLNAWLRKGAFPNAFKIGGSWRIPREEVRAYAKTLYGDRTGKRSPAVRRSPKEK